MVECQQSGHIMRSNIEFQSYYVINVDRDGQSSIFVGLAGLGATVEYAPKEIRLLGYTANHSLKGGRAICAKTVSM